MTPEVVAPLLFRKALFPALLIVASIVMGAVVGVPLIVRPDRAVSLSGLNAENSPATDAEPASVAPTQSAATMFETFGFRSETSLAVAPAPMGDPAEGTAAAAPVSVVAAGSPSDSEAGRLRSQILRVAREFPGSSRRDILVRRLASLSPLEALACVGELPDDDARKQSVAVIASDWVAADPAGAILAVNGFRDATIGREFHLDVVEQLVRTQPSRALALVKSLPSSRESLELLGEVFRQWAKNAPRLATARAMELERGPERCALLADVLTIWARQDVNDAVRAVIVLPDREESRATLAGVVRRLSEDGEAGNTSLGAAFVRAVMARALQTASEGGAYEISAAAVDVLGQLEFDAITPFVDALPEGYDRARLLTRMVSLVAPEAPARAAAYAMKLASGAERVAAIRIAASGMVRSDEGAALEWLEGIAGLEDRAAATQAVFFEIRDLALAERWLQSRMVKADADAAIQSFVLRATREDPPLAASWARQIRDISLRYFAIEAVARAWLRTNRPASEAWLARTDLPETRVHRLLAR